MGSGAVSLAATGNAITSDNPASGGGGSKPWTFGRVLSDVWGATGVPTVLHDLNYGASYVRSGLNQLGQAMHGNGFDLGQFQSDASHQLGGQDYALRNNPNFANLPAWQRVLSGLVYDVATDPLSYVKSPLGARVFDDVATGAKDATQAANETSTLSQLAEKLKPQDIGRPANYKEVATRLADAGLSEDANKVFLAKNAAAASPDALENVGVKLGGSIGLFGKGYDLPFGDKLAGLKRDTLSAGEAALRDTNIGDRVAKVFQNPAMADLARSNPAEYLLAKQKGTILGALGEGAKARGIDSLTRLKKQYADVDPQAMRRYVEDPASLRSVPAAARARVREAGDAFKTWQETVVSDVEKATGKTINRLDNYLPHQLNDVGKEEAARGVKGATAFNSQRSIKKTLEQLISEGKDRLGADYQDVWRTDPYEIGARYARSSGEFIKREGLAQHFVDRGLVTADKAAALAKSTRYQNAQAKILAKATEAASRADAIAADAKTKAKNLGKRITQPNADEVTAAELAATTAEKTAAESKGKLGDLKAARTEADQALRESTKVPKVTAPPSGPVEKALAALEARKSALEDLKASAPATAAETATGDAVGAAAATAVAGTRDPKEILAEASQLKQLDAAIEQAKASGNFTAQGKTITVLGKPMQADTAAKFVKQRIGELADEYKKATATVKPAAVAAPAVDKAAQVAHQAKVAKAEAAVSTASDKHLAAVAKHTDAMAKYDSAKAATADHFDTVVASNRAKLDQLDKKIEKLSGKAKVQATEARSLRSAADKIAQKAAAEPDPKWAEVGRLTSLAKTQEATATEARKTAIGAQHELTAMRGLQARKDEFSSLIQHGFSDIAGMKNRIAIGASHEEVANVLADLVKFDTNHGHDFWTKYDAVMARWKALRLLRPGTNLRNFFGAWFNNALAGVTDAKLYEQVGAAHLQFKLALAKADALGRDGAFDAIKDPQMRDIFKELDKYGQLNFRQVPDISDIEGPNMRRAGVLGRLADRGGAGTDTVNTLNKIDPTSLDFKPFQLNRVAGENVSQLGRNVLYVDSRLRGMGEEEALQRVFKYHHDFNQLQPWERTWAKRVMPFYTWSRLNLPLQLESMAASPGEFARYMTLKRNADTATGGGGSIIPAYFERLMEMPTGFKTNNGDQIFFAPDLPFMRMSQTLNTNDLLSSLTPVLKTPLQSITNHNFFTGQTFSKTEKPVPQTWAWLMPALHAVSGVAGLPKVDKVNGQWVMSEKDSQKIEDFLPVLGQTRRLVPNEPKYQDRLATTWLSYLFGVNARTLDKATIQGEELRRAGK